MSDGAYNEVFSELQAVEAKTGLYLADEGADHENATDAGLVRGSEEYWTVMIASAWMAAGQRAEEAGQNINKLLGKVVY